MQPMKSIHSPILIFCFIAAFATAAHADSKKTVSATQQQGASIIGQPKAGQNTLNEQPLSSPAIAPVDNYMIVDEQRLDTRTAKIFGETYQFFQQRSPASKWALRSMFLNNYRYKKLADQAVKDEHDGNKQEIRDKEEIKSEEEKQEKEGNSIRDALLMDALIDEAVLAENQEDDKENTTRQAVAFPPAPAIPAAAATTAPPDTALADTENQYDAQLPPAPPEFSDTALELQPPTSTEDDQDKKAWYVFLVMNGSEHTVRHLAKGYTVTAYSSTRAVIDGSVGVTVLHDGEEVVIGGVKYVVMIIPDKGMAMPPITAACCINISDATTSF